MAARFHGKGFPSTNEHPEGYHDHEGYYDEKNNATETLQFTCYTLINTTGFQQYEKTFNDIVYWIKTYVTDWRDSCRWIKINDCSYFYIKNKIDNVLFWLTWSEVCESAEWHNSLTKNKKDEYGG